MSSGSSASSIRATWSATLPPPTASAWWGRGRPSSGEERAGHLLVVVLAGVDEHHVVVTLEHGQQGSRLDELRPRADDRDDAHRQSVAVERLRSLGAMSPITSVRTSRRYRAP
jgi:hypothetical protein